MPEHVTQSDIAAAYMRTGLQEERRGVSEEALAELGGGSTYDEALTIMHGLSRAIDQKPDSPSASRPHTTAARRRKRPLPNAGPIPGESEGEITPAGHQPFVPLEEEYRQIGRANLPVARQALQRAIERSAEE